MELGLGPLEGMAGLVGVLLLATEFIGRALGVRKDQVALVGGPLLGVIAHLTAIVDVPGTADLPVWQALLASAFWGLLATAAAGVVKDKVIAPTTKPRAPGAVDTE